MKPHTDNIIETIYKYLSTEQQDWILSGFIDPDKNIYTFGSDSKIIGRLFEVLVTKPLLNAARELGYELGESEKQTVYPDFYFKKPNGRKIAIDIKTTYKKSAQSKFGFTGGSFTSFMRNGTKNIYGHYNDYDAHYILGIVYEREESPTTGILSLEDLNSIRPAYKNIEFFIQEKFRICGETKGSGNTDNIGTILSTTLSPFIFGAGPFNFLGEEVFHDYWTHFPKYKDSKEIKDSLFNSIDSYINWVAKKDDKKAKEIRLKYNEYLSFYESMENNNWK
ncbi:restriction endonuclease [Granulicatella sp. zg-ZJ]|uniref:type II restriction endonuclease n=1 Tax=Granulicatella sp. zg-ZJ TaxID=2678504 RepID=UPI0013D2CE41|nr:type II restriction endonuclease [Granulicatella sp. zg-ZJ]NEW62262.1 restriction endonuclease [Granulicatella sp. zg-ZJ]